MKYELAGLIHFLLPSPGQGERRRGVGQSIHYHAAPHRKVADLVWDPDHRPAFLPTYVTYVTQVLEAKGALALSIGSNSLAFPLT